MKKEEIIRYVTLILEAQEELNKGNIATLSKEFSYLRETARNVLEKDNEFELGKLLTKLLDN